MKAKRYIETGRRQYHKNYFQLNKPRMYGNNLEWRSENPGRVSRYNRDYYESNVEYDPKIYNSLHLPIRISKSEINKHIIFQPKYLK